MCDVCYVLCVSRYEVLVVGSILVSAVARPSQLRRIAMPRPSKRSEIL